MQQPTRFTLAQLPPEQRTRVIAILVQLLLRQWSQFVTEKQNERPSHENPA